jgi:hypothetical protein
MPGTKRRFAIDCVELARCPSFVDEMIPRIRKYYLLPMLPLLYQTKLLTGVSTKTTGLDAWTMCVDRMVLSVCLARDNS